MLKVLFFSLFTFLIQDDILLSPDSPKDCGNLKATFSTTKEGNRAKVDVDITGGTAPFRYIFYKESGDLLSNEFDARSVSGLSKGKFFCTVVDKNNCKRTI